MDKIRVLLRPIKKKDSVKILPLLDKGITKWIHNIPYPPKERNFLKWLAQISEKKNKTFLIIDKNKSVALGMIWIESLTKQQGEIGFWIAKNFQRKGYVKEAGNLIIKYADEKLHLEKLVALTVDHNKASQKALESLGFKLEKTLKKDFKDKLGKWCDVLIYEMQMIK